MKKILTLIASIAGLLVPVSALAHVKWFVDTEETISQLHGTIPFYSWKSPEVLIWCGITALAVLLFRKIDQITPVPAKLLAFGKRNKKTIHRTTEVILGIFLVTVSVAWKIVLAPNIHAMGTLLSALMITQAIIGGMFIVGVRVRVASVALLALCAAIGIYDGLEGLLENTILISLAFYFYIVHSPEGSQTAIKWGPRALDIVRIGTGVSLIVLAFTEKLLYPELSLQFLSTHHWNFMQDIFPLFTDKLFVLSTGFAELIFGLLFIFGYVTRATTVLIAIFFATSVTTMLIQTGIWEVEDLIVYAAAILFIFFREGNTLFYRKNT